MQVGFNQALASFHALEPSLQAPSLHPAYVEADARRDAALEPVYFLHREGEAIYYHAFHLARVPETAYRDIQSPYGYGGPVASSSDPSFLAGAERVFSAWCAEHRVLAEFLRFHPLLENWRFYDGEVLDDRQTVWIPLEGDVFASYSTRARTAVRKAVNQGLAVEWVNREELAAVFPGLYEPAMRALETSAFYFFPDAYYRALQGWERLHFAVCRQNSEAVAAAVFLLGPAIAEYHLSASSPLGKQLGATNLLLHEAALRAQAQGCRALHLGGGTDASPENSLLFFKGGFSKVRAGFKIGKRVRDAAGYRALRAKWEQSGKILSNRVLFYR
jgi:hypothetical protein